MTTPYLRRYYAGGGTATNLSNAMAATDTSFVINSDTGWPGSPGNSGGFIVVVDRGTSSEEKIRCSSNSGTTVTVASDGNGGRGYDGTSATSHNANATVLLCGGAIDFDEANQVVTQVLGQSGAAKGDILYMLSAAGPNTLQRLAVGSNGSLLSAASAVPAYTAAGSAGQLLQSAGSAVPTFNSTLLQGIASSSTGSGTSSSSSYGNLSSVSAAVTVTTGTLALVILTGTISLSAAGQGLLSFAISGNTTLASADARSFHMGDNSTDANPQQASYVSTVTLTTGSNTFTAQAKVVGTVTATITNVVLTVIPLN